MRRRRMQRKYQQQRGLSPEDLGCSFYWQATGITQTNCTGKALRRTHSQIWSPLFAKFCRFCTQHGQAKVPVNWTDRRPHQNNLFESFSSSNPLVTVCWRYRWSLRSDSSCLFRCSCVIGFRSQSSRFACLGVWWQPMCDNSKLMCRRRLKHYQHADVRMAVHCRA